MIEIKLNTKLDVSTNIQARLLKDSRLSKTPFKFSLRTVVLDSRLGLANDLMIGPMGNFINVYLARLI